MSVSNYQKLDVRLNNILDYREVQNDAARRGTYAVHGNGENNLQKFGSYLKTLNEGLGFQGFKLAASAPMTVRNTIIAWENRNAAIKGSPNLQNIRMKTFFAGTIGLALSLIARVIRIAFKTIFLIPMLLHAAYKESKINEEGLVEDVFFRYFHEIGDLFITLYAGIVALINTLKPDAISTEGLRNYYVDRIDEIHVRDEVVDKAQTRYDTEKKKIADSYKNAQAVPAIPLAVPPSSQGQG